MNKKISIGVTAILLIIAICSTAVGTVFIYLAHYDELIALLPQRAQQYDRISEVDELIRSEYYGNINYDSLDYSLIQGYLSGLDENCYYIPADDYDMYARIINGNLAGVGLSLYFDEESSSLNVTSVTEGSPAMQAGLTVGCVINEVNGKSVTQDNQSDLVTLLTKTYDEKIKVVYSSNDTDKKEVQLTSGYVGNSVSYSINDSVGYVRITDFYENTAELFSKAINHFIENSVSAVIIDLRNTQSTGFDFAADIIDMIVPVGTEGTGAIYTAKNSDAVTVKQRSSDSASLNLSFAVLINSRTSGAAELLACDLSDYSKAKLFGEKTYGNGTYQELFRLSDGSAVSLTVAQIYPYISDSFNGIGVAPDVEIITSDSFKNQIGSADLKDDTQYLSAFSYLSGQK